MSSLDFPTDIQQFLRQEVASGHFQSEAAVVVVALRRFRDSDAKPSDVSAENDAHVLNWDDLIPAAPERPGGHLPVRLKSADRDKPLPAEHPWAK